MKRFVIGVAALFVVVLPTTASAATPLTWVAGSGLGSDAVPCAGAEHWLLSDATQVSSASLLVGGTTYAMQQDNGNQWSADTDAPLVVGDVAVATYEGDGTPTLSLGSCTAASSPTRRRRRPRLPPTRREACPSEELAAVQATVRTGTAGRL